MTCSHHPRPMVGKPWCTLLLTGFTITWLVGCGQQQDARQPSSTATKQREQVRENGDQDGHDHVAHSLPETFAEAIAELKEHYTTIKDAFAQANGTKLGKSAHESLHDVGLLLDALPDLAKKANQSAETVATVKQAAETMFTCYGNIDSAVHHGEQPDYRAESEKLDTAMATLEATLEVGDER